MPGTRKIAIILRRVAALGITAFAIPLSLARGVETMGVAAAPVLDDRYPAREHGFPLGVTGIADVTYSTLAGFRPLTLDLYLPKPSKPESPRPLIVFVHGGGWQSGHSRQSGAFENWPRTLASLAARGFVVSSVNYRLSREAPFPAALDDVKTAIRWLRASSADFGIDKDRVLVWGNSAGGELAALAAVHCSVADNDCVQGAVAWYGMFDFTAAPLDAVSLRYLGCTAAPCPAALSASPALQVRADSPPFLLIHGANDQTVPAEQSRAFSRALLAAGGRAELLIIPDVGHSFIGATPASTRASSLLALQRTFDFIAATLRRH